MHKSTKTLPVRLFPASLHLSMSSQKQTWWSWASTCSAWKSYSKRWEHLLDSWVNFSSLVTAVVITFNFRVHLHHIPYSTARLLLLRHPTFFAPGKFYCLTVYKFLSSWLNLATELGLNLYRPLVIVVQHCVGYTSISSPARGKKERSRWQFETQVVFFTVPLLFNL